MTGKQISAAQEEIYAKYRHYPDYPIGSDEYMEESDKILEEELSCREMINSILIYGGSCDKESYQHKRYLLPYTQKGTWHDGLISEERLEELITEQKADFAKAEVGFSGYDSEGVSYNYCKWADELEEEE